MSGITLGQLSRTGITLADLAFIFANIELDNGAKIRVAVATLPQALQLDGLPYDFRSQHGEVAEVTLIDDSPSPISNARKGVFRLVERPVAAR